MLEESCCNSNDCNMPKEQCSIKCPWYNMTCGDCSERQGEECAVDGHEVYVDSAPCERFIENDL